MNHLISIFAVGILIALHELGHFTAARRVGMTVIRYSIGLLHSVVSWTSKKSGVVYQIGILPLGGFVQIKGMNPFEKDAFEAPDSYQNKSPWRRFIVLFAGPFANLLVGWLLYFSLAMSGIPDRADEARVGMVVAGGPAEAAGLQTDDRVMRFNGESLSTWSELADRLHKHPGQEVVLEIEREGQQMTVRVTPEDKNGVGLIGIGQPTRLVRVPPHQAAVVATAKCVQIVTDMFGAIGAKLSGTGASVQAVGPVGIIRMAASAFDSGLRYFLNLVAYLSIMLFLFNLLPFPALDGGRGMFLLFEVITRRRPSPRVDAIANMVGFFILIGLLLIITAGELFGG
ncbi:MAG: M50 family metallopeptidase [Myxococcota bacterium]|nr:M50 family metallopeptidase [Myxococcota bacterium]